MQRQYVVFGGTFDPIHAGHVDAMRFLLERFPLVIIAPTTRNPWKADPPTPVELRRAMINLVLEAEGLPRTRRYDGSGVIVSEFPYVYAKDFVGFARRQVPGECHWAVGEDVAPTVTKWHDWPELHVPIVTIPERVPVHATAIRRQEALCHPALSQFVEEHGLYRH